MHHYLLLSRGNFHAEKQHSNKVMPSGARESGNYASPCICENTSHKTSFSFGRVTTTSVSHLSILPVQHSGQVRKPVTIDLLIKVYNNSIISSWPASTCVTLVFTVLITTRISDLNLLLKPLNKMLKSENSTQKICSVEKRSMKQCSDERKLKNHEAQ